MKSKKEITDELIIQKKQIISEEDSRAAMMLCRKTLEQIVDTIFQLNDTELPKNATLLEKINNDVIVEFFDNSIILDSLHYVRKMGMNALHERKVRSSQVKIAKDNTVFAIDFLLNQLKKKTSAAPLAVPKYMSESETRKEYIDQYLIEAGWEVVEPNSKTVLPDGTKVKSGTASPDRACSEIPVTGMKNQSGIGFCDYVLYGKNRKPLAIIEAKKTSVDPTTGQQQVKEYGRCMKEQYGYVPILYYTNGYEIYVIDGLYPSRRVSSFHTETELEYLIQKRERKPIALTDLQIKDNISGRPYQKMAITAVCERLDKLQRRSLVVMATGTGKTRVSISLVEVLARNNWIKNVLFLADRTSLVRQAFKNFNDLLPNMTYCVLSDKSLANQPNARITLSTHQTMINYIDAEDKEYSIGRFDLIIVDEAHRSIFKKYGSIFEYFDAFLVGLTATPKDEVDANTYQLFNCESGEPTFVYSLKEAVQDKYLVDYKVINKTTKLMKESIKYKDLSKEDKDKVDTVLEDDPNNDTIINPSKEFTRIFNKGTCRVVLEDLMTKGLKVNGGQDIGKSIIFAFNHKHAKLIVDTFKEMYPHYGEDYCVLIDNQIKGAENLIEQFGSRQNMRIAVSVDMLDTGIDVPSVLNLVFFKKVRSRIKFVQMIGRGTRLCEGLIDGNDKQYFLIFDYCSNFEFFDEHPDGDDGNTILSLSQKLFSLRLDILVELQKYQHQIVPARKAYYEKIKPMLIDKILELKQMSNYKISVRNQMKYVDKYCNRNKWDAISQLELKEINYYLTDLIENDPKQDPYALSFDYKMIFIELSILVEGNISQAIQQIKNIRDIAGSLLQKASIKAVMDKAESLKTLVDIGFWNSNPEVDKLEYYREEIRDLMKYLVGENPKVIIDTADSTIDILYSKVNLADVRTYKEKVLDYLFEHSDDPVIKKIQNLEYLNEDDFEELESILWNKLGTRDDYKRITKIDNLAVFIRSIVGISQESVNEKFGEYLSGNILNSYQQEFIYSIINYVRENGDITPQVILKQKPFSTQNLNQLFGTNAYIIGQIVNTMHNTVSLQANA